MEKKSKQEMLEKAADAMNQGAKKLDEIVDKRSVLGEFAAPVTLGVLLVLVVVLVQQPGLLVLLGLGVALGLSPKIIKMALAKKAELDAKKAAKTEEKK